ncbi:Ankyrin repeat protein [Pandoravirus kuranda]|uniref:Ankyrin repeat protein n=1 Tax=Pandoravirus kuranda TaxID=3019033 RepID=A0AA95EFA0_9VIRU|nr:Ankyrin repeat protein [Pandoravirus kuranda]
MTETTAAAATADTVRGSDSEVVPSPVLPAIPVELLWHIQGYLVHPRDHAACVLASRLFSLALLRRSLCEVSAYKLLRARAPLDVIQRALVHPTEADAERLTGSGAHLGRLDVVAWAYDHLDADYVLYTCSADRMPNKHVLVDGYWNRKRWQSIKLFPSDVRKRYVGIAVNAMHEAAYRGNVDVLKWLLDRHFPPGGARPDHLERDLFTALVADAAGGVAASTDIVAYLHHYGQSRFPPVNDMYRGRVCACPMRTWEAAANADRGDMLAWLDASACSGRFNPDLVPWASPVREARGRHPLILAMQQGAASASEWLGRALGVPTWPSADPLLAAALVTAASRGHVRVLRAFHGLGAQSCPPSALLEAASAGRIEVLQWAMGDGAATQHAVPRIPGWPSPSIGCAAAAHGHIDAVRWLVARSDASVNVGVGAHVAAVRANHMGVACTLIDAHILPLDQWDALYAAVKSRDPNMIRCVAERGAACSARALACAIRQSDTTAVALLCRLYGTVRVQEALDLLAGCCTQMDAVAWIRDSVPGACVAQVGARRWLACRCPRCCQGLDAP